MPYRSEAQRRFLHARHPEIAARWDAKYETPTHLPQHVSTTHAQRRVALIRKMQKKAT